MRFATILCALGVLSLTTGCSSDESTEVWSVPVDDGGYALVRVDVPGSEDVRVRVVIEDAREGETYYLLFRERRAPRAVGWFDVGPYAGSAAACSRDAADDDDGDDDDGCDPVGAGRFVSMGTARAGGPLELSHEGAHCWRPDGDSCSRHYAVVSGSRLAATRRARFTVTTKDPLHASPARMQLLH